MKTVKKNLKRFERHSKGLFWSLTCLLFLVTSFYVYLMNTMAQNGVRWENGEKEATSVSATVSELESQYLSLKQSVTLSMAYERGFEDVKTVRFISAKKVGTVAAVNEI